MIREKEKEQEKEREKEKTEGWTQKKEKVTR